ncbi:MAG: hypothetical protein HUK22_05820, partial [Thermoguttaceae bacterium]|nr:hypothetical protein [Thermoguttaceae bacterium]
TLYAEALAAAKQNAEALDVIDEGLKRFPEFGRLAILRPAVLLALGRPEEALNYLETNVFLPCEGSVAARGLFREAALRSAVAAYKNDDFAAARRLVEKARTWPENLGAGKPYPDAVDERLEDWFDAKLRAALGEDVAAPDAEGLNRENALVRDVLDAVK